MAPQVYAALTRVVVASPLPEDGWYSAAEAALTALYALHPAPEHLSAAVLRHLARAAFAPAAAGAKPAASEQSGQQPEPAASEASGEAMDADDEAAPASDEDGASEEGAGEEGGEEPAPAASQQASGSQGPRAMHSVVALSRFFFALGHVALQHLVRPCWQPACCWAAAFDGQWGCEPAAAPVGGSTATKTATNRR